MSAPQTEVILSQPQTILGHLTLEWNPQPGNFVEVAGQAYLVLERRHRYLLKAGRYQLHKIALYVQKTAFPTERSFMNGDWVIGDLTCRYNARSQLIRCAVNPDGPCDRCVDYQPSDHCSCNKT